MKKNTQAFSLIEIIVASTILTIGVFGVYKLIGNNMNLISNNENYVALKSLNSPFKECLKSIGYNSLSGSYNTGNRFSINFGDNNMKCFTGTYNSNFDFTGVILDNNEFFLYSSVTQKDSEKIDLELNIFSPGVGYLYNSGTTENKNLTIYNKEKIKINIEEGGDDDEGDTTPSCATIPTFENIGTITIGTPTEVNQAWTYNETQGNCTYVCINGYSGTNCSIAPVVFTALCTANGQIIYTDVSGNEIGRVDNTGVTVSGTPGNLTTTGHIVVCNGNQTGYVLKSVNEGATAVGATTTSTAYGNRYQFGRTDTTRNNGNSSFNYDWKSPGGTDAGSANDWGVTESVKTTATYFNSNFTSQTKMKGPCPTGYHVPTNKEWNDTITAWGGGTNGTNLSNALKLLFAGARYRWGGSIVDKDTGGYYWSSSPDDINGYNLYFGSSIVYPNDYLARAYGFSVRCFKN